MSSTPPAPNRLEVCRLVAESPEMALDLTGKGRTVALISNGGDLPGLGALGPLAALPYLEDQASLIERMTNLRVLPLAVNSSSSEEIAAFTATLAPSAGILCLDSLGDEVYQAVERPLAESGLPFFFNPQQSRPILILTAISKALALTGRDLSSARIVLAGFESDSLAMADFLLAAGAGNLVLCDRSGVIHKGRPGPTSWLKEQLAQKTNPQQIKGGLNRALAGADVYVSRATPMAVTKDVANMMAHRPILLNFSQNLASANPLTAGTEPIGLGFGPGPDTRLPANLLTALVLSGLFSGALKARARSITMAMRLAASRALEELIDEPGRLLPLFSRPRLVEKVATAVAAVAIPNSRPSPNAD